jgi:hypothetical protein
MANTVPDEVPIDPYPPDLYQYTHQTDYVDTFDDIGDQEMTLFNGHYDEKDKIDTVSC